MSARLALIVSGLTIAASLGGAGAASADPKGEAFPVVCENGITYQVTDSGNGAFTPAHDVGSTSTLIPVAFGEFHGTVTDSEGNMIEEFVDPPASKGSSGKHVRATTTSCTFTITETFDDADLGLITFTGEGSVTGFVTPVR